MLPVFLDVSLKTVKAINAKVDEMLDDLYDMSDNLTDFDCIEFLFPACKASEDPNWCVKTLKQFRAIVNDSYQRDYLEPKYEYILFQLIHYYLDVQEEMGIDVDLHYEKYDENEDVPEEAYIEGIKEYPEFLFQDHDFLLISSFLTPSAEPNMVTSWMGVDIDEYLELMPEDIRRRYFENCEARKARIKEDQEIIESFKKAIYEIEAQPTLCKDYKEPKINDMIAALTKQYLSSVNITVTREAPMGYALKNTGEVDFFLFESKTKKSIAIGESKDAKLFLITLQQLLGYMNRDTKFGFTISINQDDSVDMVQKRILDTLEKLKENAEFETIKIEHSDDLIVSLHRMPEDNTKFIVLYHLILNRNTGARKNIAKLARKNGKHY